MPNFENYAEEARRIEHEIVRLGIALGIDWDDEVAVRMLARQALAAHGNQLQDIPDALERRTRFELFGLAQLMLSVMAQSAEEGLETHGGPVWKAFGRALWLESGGTKRNE
jgi:hypothetical protein